MDLQTAMGVLAKGAHQTKREALGVIQAQVDQIEHLQSQVDQMQQLVEHFMGPDHTPPPEAPLRKMKVARPAIMASYWTKGPWHCLRIEERTVGYLRPRAFFNKETKKVELRNDTVTDQWMSWVTKLAQAFKIEPLEGPVRLVLFPGNGYTFAAWREVSRYGFETALIHPQDPDNAVKPITDALQTGKQRKLAARKLKKLQKEGRDPDEALLATATHPYGGWENDTQVVDMMIYRLAQPMPAPVNRTAIRKERKQARKASELLKKTEAQASII